MASADYDGPTMSGVQLFWIVVLGNFLALVFVCLSLWAWTHYKANLIKQRAEPLQEQAADALQQAKDAAVGLAQPSPEETQRRADVMRCYEAQHAYKADSTLRAHAAMAQACTKAQISYQ